MTKSSSIHMFDLQKFRLGKQQLNRESNGHGHEVAKGGGKSCNPINTFNVLYV